MCRWARDAASAAASRRPPVVHRRRSADRSASSSTAQGDPTLTAWLRMPVPVTFKPGAGRGRPTTGSAIRRACSISSAPSDRPVVRAAADRGRRGPVPAARAVAGRRVPRPRRRAVRARGRPRVSVRRLEPTASYRAWWASTTRRRRRAFEAVIDLIIAGVGAHPEMHVYHFTPLRADGVQEADGPPRHARASSSTGCCAPSASSISTPSSGRPSARASRATRSRSSSSIYGFARQRRADGRPASRCWPWRWRSSAGAPDAITGAIRDAVQGYNEDDCRSTEALRDWLEWLRAEGIAAATTSRGQQPKTGEAVAEGRRAATAGRGDSRAAARPAFPRTPRAPAHADHAPLAAGLPARLAPPRGQGRLVGVLPPDGDCPRRTCFDERDALAGLKFVERLGLVIGKNGKPTESVIDRYAYPAQDIEIGREATLHARDGEGVRRGRGARPGRTADRRQQGPEARGDAPDARCFRADVISTKAHAGIGDAAGRADPG